MGEYLELFCVLELLFFLQILALICPVVLVVAHIFIPAKNRSTLTLPYWLSLAPLYLWLLVFVAQPHKEER